MAPKIGYCTPLTGTPTLKLRVSSPIDYNLSIIVDAIICTGASITCVPKRLIDAIGIDYLDYSVKTVEDNMGRMMETNSYIVDMQLLNCEFKDVEIAVLDCPVVLIGRDIIGKFKTFKMTFNANNGDWNVHAKY